MKREHKKMWREHKKLEKAPVLRWKWLWSREKPFRMSKWNRVTGNKK